MRQPTDLCKLCLTKSATKTKSHIISKFLVDSMFVNEGPRVGYLIDPKSKKGIGKKVQDSPKEDYILCPVCEERIGVVERYASNNFHRSLRTNDLDIAHPLIVPNHPDSLPYVMIPGLDDHRFRIFIYSLLWRASISNADGFRTLKLKANDEEKIRELLFNLLPQTPASKEANLILDTNKHLPFLPMVISTPEKITNSTQNFLGGFNHNDNDAILFINEYSVIIYMDWLASSEGAAQFNLPKSSLAVTIVSEQYWEEQNISFAKWLAEIYHDNR